MQSLSAEYKDLYLSIILMLLLSWAFAFIRFVSLYGKLFNILMTALYILLLKHEKLTLDL